MQVDEIAYMDQLHGKANDKDVPLEERERAKRRFLDWAFTFWPEISEAFDEHKHSL